MPSPLHPFLACLVQPVIVWSFIIGGVGLALPLVVPPIREAMGIGAPTPKAPPPVRTVSCHMRRGQVPGWHAMEHDLMAQGRVGRAELPLHVASMLQRHLWLVLTGPSC